MESNKDIKSKINTIVDSYLTTYNMEAKAFLVAHKAKLDNQSNKFGKIKGSDMVERVLHEVPETLFIMLKTGLEEHEWEWWISKEGGRWFAKKFKAMSLTK